MTSFLSANEKRVNWLDVAKIIGIFCIYIGHLQYYAGYAYEFVFRFHVQLFFFLAGCAENFNNRRMGASIARKVCSLLIPFYVFGIMSIAVDCLMRNSYEYLYLKCFKLLMGAGREDGFVAFQLWFLSSLFICYVLFYLIKGIAQNRRLLVLMMGMIVYFVYFFCYSKLPSFYNINYTFAYFHFFIIGYLIYPCLDKWFLALENVLLRIIRFIVSAVCIALTAYFYFGRDVVLLQNKFISYDAVIIIYVVICISYFVGSMAKDKKFTYGADTLYFCGNEFAIKALFPQLMGLFGLTIIIDEPMQCYFYTILLMWFQHRLIIPWEKMFVGKIQNDIDSFVMEKITRNRGKK